MNDVIEGQIQGQELAPLQQQLPMIVATIGTMVNSKHINVEALNMMLDVQERIMDRQAKMDYAAAMVNFNAIKKPIKTNRKGKTAGNALFAYADFPELVKNVSPWLAQCGLSFSHRQDAPTLVEGEVKLIMVHCDVKHVSGHCETVSFPAIPDERLRDKLSPSQLIQLALTYAKRQTLCLALGIAAHEDKNCDDSTKPGAEEVGPISKEQLAKLKKEVEQWVVNVPKFMDWLKVENLEELPSDMYDRAMKQIETLKKKKAK